MIRPARSGFASANALTRRAISGEKVARLELEIVVVEERPLGRESPARSKARRLIEFKKSELLGGLVIRLGLLPVHHVPPRFHIIGAAVLVVKIIGVFPDVESKTGLPSKPAMEPMVGLSWFAVEPMASLPPWTTSQAQPLPKRPAPAASNLVLNSSKLPKVLSIALASSPDWLPLGVRLHQLPEHGVIDWPSRHRCCAPARGSPRARARILDEDLRALFAARFGPTRALYSDL
jgi:hypothetical protein